MARNPVAITPVAGPEDWGGSRAAALKGWAGGSRLAGVVELEYMVCLVLVALLAQAAAAEHAVFRSVDGGVRWARAGASLPGNPRVNSFGAIANRVFAGTDAGIFATDDEGRSWRRTSVTTRTISFATSGATVYAGTQGAGLLASNDRGLTWNSVTSLAARNIRALLVGKGLVIAGTDGDGVMVSSNHGMTWVAHNAGLPRFSQIFGLALVDETVFAALYAKGLYAWRKGEPRWIEDRNRAIRPLALATDGGTLAVGHNPGGLYWSQRPGSGEWTAATGGFAPPAPVWEMAAGNGLVLAGVADGVYRSNDGGRTWLRALQGLPPRSSAVSFLVRGSTVFAGLVIGSESRK